MIECRVSRFVGRSTTQFATFEIFDGERMLGVVRCVNVMPPRPAIELSGDAMTDAESRINARLALIQAQAETAPWYAFDGIRGNQIGEAHANRQAAIDALVAAAA